MINLERYQVNIIGFSLHAIFTPKIERKCNSVTNITNKIYRNVHAHSVCTLLSVQTIKYSNGRKRVCIFDVSSLKSNISRLRKYFGAIKEYE